jgi:hypothetical protein
MGNASVKHENDVTLEQTNVYYNENSSSKSTTTTTTNENNTNGDSNDVVDAFDTWEQEVRTMAPTVQSIQDISFIKPDSENDTKQSMIITKKVKSSSMECIKISQGNYEILNCTICD